MILLLSSYDFHAVRAVLASRLLRDNDRLNRVALGRDRVTEASFSKEFSSLPMRIPCLARPFSFSSGECKSSHAPFSLRQGPP